MKKILIVLLSVLTSVCLFLTPAAAFSASGSTIYKGVDVSAWNGTIDYAKVKNSGIEVVYIRAGEGNENKDTYFENNYSGAKSNGLKIGFYYYVTATTVAEAEAQATYFVSLLSGKSFDCKPAMDFEEFGDLNNEEINQIALAFIGKVVQASGKEAVVYSDLSNARDVFDARLAAYPLWIAEYGVSQPGNPVHWGEWVGFQHSDTGSVPGVSGNVDLDQFTDGIFLTEQPTVTSQPETTSVPVRSEPAGSASVPAGTINPKTGDGAGLIGIAIAGAAVSLMVIGMIWDKKERVVS